jgi:hypothetical protein
LLAVSAGAAPSDVLVTAHNLVEVADNTRANLEKAIALYDKSLVDEAIPVKERAAGYAPIASTGTWRIKARRPGRAA